MTPGRGAYGIRVSWMFGAEAGNLRGSVVLSMWIGAGAGEVHLVTGGGAARGRGLVPRSA